MMTKLEKLIVSLTALADEATVYLEMKNGKKVVVQPHIPFPKAAEDKPLETAYEAQPVEVVAPKAPRKPRTPKVVAPVEPAPVTAPLTEEEAIAEASAEQAAHEEKAQSAEPQKPPMDEEQSFDRMMEVTKQWVILAKNDTPKDGKTMAMAWLRAEPYGVEKLGDLTHGQRLMWIADMEAAIREHK